MRASQFLEKLQSLQTEKELENVQRFFSYEGIESKFLGVKMANIFALAKKFIQMPLSEIEKLLDSEYYEARMGAVSIMDFQARDKNVSVVTKKKLFELYISKHAQINNWDMVDRAAPYVVGGYLFNKPRKTLYKLAKSKNVWERRTAIVATYFFIRQNDLDDTFKIAEILVNDKHELINKAVGSWIREAGKRDKYRLLDFLNRHASTISRITLRYAIEKLDKKSRDNYSKLKQYNP